MRLELKRRGVVALVVFVLFWPALQAVVVDHTRSNPWHGFGMAMYAVPYRVTGIGIARVYDGQPRAFDEGQVGEELEARTDEYAALFEGGGLWAPREPLRAALAAADPSADSFLVVPRVMRLNTDTAMLEIEKVRIEFESR